MAIALANSRDGEGRLSMASLGAVASIAHHKHQMFRHGYAGQTRRGCHVEAPVAPYELQDRSNHAVPVRAGFLRDDLPNLLKTCPGLRGSGLSHCRSDARTSRCCVRKRVCLVPPGQTRAYSLRLADCSPLLRNSLAHKQVIQAVAYGPHLSRLSSSLSLRPDQYGRSEKAWRYLISVMRCPT